MFLGLGPARLQRRKHARGQGDQQAQPQEHRAGDRVEGEMGARSGEIAAAEVSAEQAQRQLRKAEAQRDSSGGPDQSHQSAFNEQLGDEGSPGQAQHPQQGELRSAQGRRQRLRRIDKEAARQQSDHRQHLKIDPIGPREAVAAAGLGLARNDLGVARQDFADLDFDTLPLSPGCELQVDPLQPP